MVHEGLLSGHHAEGAALGGGLVEDDVSDDIFAIHEDLHILGLRRSGQKGSGVGDHRIGHVGLEVAVDHIDPTVIAHGHLLGRRTKQGNDFGLGGFAFFDLGERIGIDLSPAVGTTDESAKRQCAEGFDDFFHMGFSWLFFSLNGDCRL